MKTNDLYRDEKDLTGYQFGYLTVMRQASNDECTIEELVNCTTKWMCKCHCGKITVVPRNNLISGNTTSCGCVRNNVNNTFKSASCGNKRIRNIWYAMKARCYQRSHPCYSSYGGKGIKVCKEWLQDFNVFKDWAKQNGYADHLTIDRIDNLKDYSPDNCRWVTHLEQQSNRRNNIPTTSGLSLKAECERRGLKYNTVRMRIKRGNYTVDQALEARPTSEHCYGGKTMRDWCHELNIGHAKVTTRMSRYKIGFRDALAYYARSANNKKLVDFILNVIPNEKDPNPNYYKPRNKD